MQAANKITTHIKAHTRGGGEGGDLYTNVTWGGPLRVRWRSMAMTAEGGREGGRGVTAPGEGEEGEAPNGGGNPNVHPRARL